jgi:hypothetical protein
VRRSFGGGAPPHWPKTPVQGSRSAAALLCIGQKPRCGGVSAAALPRTGPDGPRAPSRAEGGLGGFFHELAGTDDEEKLTDPTVAVGTDGNVGSSGVEVSRTSLVASSVCRGPSASGVFVATDDGVVVAVVDFFEDFDATADDAWPSKSIGGKSPPI